MAMVSIAWPNSSPESRNSGSEIGQDVVVLLTSQLLQEMGEMVSCSSSLHEYSSTDRWEKWLIDGCAARLIDLLQCFVGPPQHSQRLAYMSDRLYAGQDCLTSSLLLSPVAEVLMVDGA